MPVPMIWPRRTEQSDLSGAIAAVRDRYRGRPVAGIVLISDGGDTSAGAAADGVIPPVYAIGVGLEDRRPRS